MNARKLIPAAALSVLAATAPAMAHTGVGATHGFVHGFMHPVSGVDHILAMVAVGLFAAHLGGRALWLVPATFVAIMAAGGAIGMSGLGIPYVETGIGLSVLVLGLVLMARIAPPVGVAMGLVGFFAIFHGHAHGAEMPADASGLAYGLGFIAATALLHAAGVGLGVVLGKAGSQVSTPLARVGGGAMALAGVGLLAGWI
jgi:urease accessory protein